MKQRTLNRSIEVVGIGLHKGVPVSMRLEPLGENQGIVFYRSDEAITIPLCVDNVINTQMATVIGKNDAVVSTIEHLLSALYAYGIDNLRIVIDNDEVPILDGSSSGYCILIEEAGILELDEPKKILQIEKEVVITQGEKYAKLSPAPTIGYDFSINFDHPVIGEQHYEFDFSLSSYKENIAKARTFGFLNEVQYLRSKGLAQGGSLENAIVLDDNKILNSEGLRYEDEFVRHKILDAMGDMALVGYTILGQYQAHASSHHLNHQLTKKLLSSKSNYRIIEFDTMDSSYTSYKDFELSYSYSTQHYHD